MNTNSSKIENLNILKKIPLEDLEKIRGGVENSEDLISIKAAKSESVKTAHALLEEAGEIVRPGGLFVARG